MELRTFRGLGVDRAYMTPLMTSPTSYIHNCCVPSAHFKRFDSRLIFRHTHLNRVHHSYAGDFRDFYVRYLGLY
jgi:hypothetical protein